MALHVTLVRDAFKGDGTLKPRIVQADTVNMDSVLDYMATDTALQETDMRATVSRFHQALLFYLRRGEKVATPLGTFQLSARGTYVDGETPRVVFKLAKVPVGTYTLEIRTRPSRKDVWVGMSRDPFGVRS